MSGEKKGLKLKTLSLAEALRNAEKKIFLGFKNQRPLFSLSLGPLCLERALGSGREAKFFVSHRVTGKTQRKPFLCYRFKTALLLLCDSSDPKGRGREANFFCLSQSHKEDAERKSRLIIF